MTAASAVPHGSVDSNMVHVNHDKGANPHQLLEHYTGWVSKYSSVSGTLEFVSRPHLPTSFSPQPLITNFMDSIFVPSPRRPVTDIDQDFNDNANPLWSLYGKEAQEFDKVTLENITSDMEGLLLFVRSLSSTLPLL